MGFGSGICLKKSEHIPSGQGLMGQTEQPDMLPSFAGDNDLARLAREGAALVLVAANGVDVLWATPAGAAVIGAQGQAEGFRFTTGLAPIERLAKLATESAPTIGARLERLRFITGRQLTVVTVAARRGALPDGASAALLTIAGHRGAPGVLPAWLAQAEPLRARTAAPTMTKPRGQRQRFTFQLDENFCFTQVSDTFRAALPDGFAVTGATWSALCQAGVRDPDNRVGPALALRETFHALPTEWPGRDGVWLDVALSATPIHDPARGFVGYRGFGVSVESGRRVETPAAPPPHDNVPPANEAPVATPSKTAADDEGRLSKSEREAFRQIARALGAPLEADEPIADDTPLVTPAADSTESETILESLADETLQSAVNEAEIEAPRQSSSETSSEESSESDDGIEDGEFIEIDTTDLIALPSLAYDEDAAPHGDSLADNATRLFDRLPIGILVSRGDVPIIMNRTLLEMTGYEDIDQFFEAGGLDAMFRGRSADQIGMAAKGGDIALQRRDGGIVAAEARMQTIQWGDLPATLMIFRRPGESDESASHATLELELRRREAELQELHAVLDTATDGIVMLDGDGRIMAMNRSAEALFGYDQNEVAGEAFITLLAPESHAAAVDYLEGLRAGGVAAVLNDGRELLGRERQGGSIPLFATLGRIGFERDPKYCLVFRDITPWKKAEADLMAAKRQAELASAQKSDFLARMSHEIRTPMSAIMGFAEVMLDERFGPIGNERYRDYLKDMHNSGAHVISLINDLLDISKIEAGRAELNFTRLDLNAAATNATNMMQNEARRSRVILRINLEETLPAIVADDRAIRQILLNLLSNAIKFSDAGGQVIVSTTLSERGEVVLRIRDTGIGMREEDIATALEPFRQVGTTRRSGGTGLGLPLTKALVEANRAALSIRSAPDKGTLVEVTFPPNRVLAE